LGRNLRHLVNTIHDLTEKGIGFKVLTGQGASLDMTTPSGKLVFGIFAALAEFERELIFRTDESWPRLVSGPGQGRGGTTQDDRDKATAGHGGDGPMGNGSR
jgi:hypothetical protein